MYKYIMILWVLIAGAFSGVAMGQTATISGALKTIKGMPVPFALVQVSGLGIGAYSDEKGEYLLEKVPFGEQQIEAYLIGYEKVMLPVTVSKWKMTLDIEMEESLLELAEVEVSGMRQSQVVKASGYSVEVVESSTFEGISKDVNFMLGSISGVNIRSTGGLGSDFELSLNGLTGNQIRYFIDGVPMENFGTALTLNNFPLSLVEHVEVYKGVVPVHLGADALGGAINITTKTHKQSFVDATYSYGSFNTHRVALNGQWASDSGVFVQFSSFYNAADNNFLMESVPHYDLEFGNSLGDISVHRFHDRYESGLVNVKAGVFEKKYADELSLGVTVAGNSKEYQHPDNNIKTVFGAFQTQNKTYMANLSYKKVFAEDWDVKANLLVGEILETVIDTSTQKVNWNQEVIQRAPTDERGELFDRRTFFELTDQLVNGNICLRYQISPLFHTTVSYTKQYLKRAGYDRVDKLNQSFTTPSTLNKEILGGSVGYVSINKKWESSVFGKQYWFQGEMVTQNYTDGNVLTQPYLQNTGYGVSTTYRFSSKWVVKGSFEKAYRLPESYELLGSGLYVQPNPSLQPENSLNGNLALINKFKYRQWKFHSDVNLFMRSTSDFIRYVPQGPFGNYDNIENVRSEGVEWSVEASYQKRFSIAPNITFQNITDQSPTDEGLPNVNYQSRIPNVPYLFANLFAKVQILNQNDQQLTFSWTAKYVHQFFLTWENLGAAADKNDIPSQLIQDITLLYQFGKGKYSVSTSLTNLTDEIAFDHFRIQKPRRGFSIQLNYKL